MNADDILTAARERLAEIDAQIATLAAERARLLRMTERETSVAVRVSGVSGLPPHPYALQEHIVYAAPTLSYG